MSTYKRENEKIKFIQDHIPNYKSISPFLDRASVEEVKNHLIHAGFYSKNRNESLDTSVINLILMAQGKKRTMIHRVGYRVKRQIKNGQD